MDNNITKIIVNKMVKKTECPICFEDNEKKIFNKLKEKVSYEQMARNIMYFIETDSTDSYNNLIKIHTKIERASGHAILGEDTEYWHGENASFIDKYEEV